MLTLPPIPYNVRKRITETVALRGINYSDRITEGDLRVSHNLSTRRWPYIATRRARTQQPEFKDCTAMTARESLIVVKGTELMIDGKSVGTVTAGEKQFAFVNTKLVIWPDKVMYDMDKKELVQMAVNIQSVTHFERNYRREESEPRYDWVFMRLEQDASLRVGDKVTIKVTRKGEEDLKIRAIIKAVGTYLGAGHPSIKSGYAFEVGTIPASFDVEVDYAGGSIYREIPNLDFICESENRLWGCSTEKQTIYGSALGDPLDFDTFAGLSTDSFTVAVGSPGPFTGCYRLGSSILFFKEQKLHKLLGSYPAEYQLFGYDVEGLQAGCHKSCATINETLFYQGIHGVYAYTGGTPTMISEAFGQQSYTNGVAGTDGDTYFLSVQDGEAHRLFTYEYRDAIWIQEDTTSVADFARIGKNLYYLDRNGGTIWLEDSGKEDPDVEWVAQFAPIYETIEGRKTFSKILLRVEVPKGAYVRVEARTDEGIWKECGRIVGREHDVIPFRVPVNRCDRFEIRLSGKGPSTILSMLREYVLRGDHR